MVTFKALYVCNLVFIYFRTRLQPQLSEFQAAEFLTSKITESFLNYRTKFYDVLQYQQNRVWYYSF